MNTSSSCCISTISLSGEIHASYCHFDGSIDLTGYMLVKHYKDYRKTLRLLDNGDILVLRSEIPPFYYRNFTVYEAETHNWTKYIDNGRIRSRFFMSLDSLIEYFTNCKCGMLYIIDEKDLVWRYLDLNQEEKIWKSVSDYIGIVIK